MEHYVTLFDSLFLPQGLALYMSMSRHLNDFTLWVLCIDDECFETLQELNLPHIKLLRLTQLESPELLEAKKTRTKGEYCWTLSPFAPRFVFETDKNIKRVTYVDADLWFLKNPSEIFCELETANKQVLITDHAYTPDYDKSANSGQFCVQFMVFTRSTESEDVRDWWEKRCIEWCYARVESGKFGDQKYLESWPTLFNNIVHVLKNKELTLAPWNAKRFPYSASVFYHFHGLRIVNDSEINIGLYPLPYPLIKHVYMPYLKDLTKAKEILMEINKPIKSQANKMTLFDIIYNICASFYISIRSQIQTGRLKWK